MELVAGQPLLIEKLVALYSSGEPALAEAGLEARQKIDDLGRFDALLDEHRLAWEHLWEECDLEIGTPAGAGVEAALHLHIFHLLQTVSRHTIDLDVGVPPRGWHGEAYRGHIFWDELFIFPFLNLRIPAISRTLLRYRYRRLPEAQLLYLRAWRLSDPPENQNQQMSLPNLRFSSFHPS